MVDIWAQEDGGIASLRRFGITEEENGVERKGMGTEAKVKDKVKAEVVQPRGGNAVCLVN